ncbi:IS66 family insertion sequence element accessory protein TnpA, partial [Pseudoalteromonas denitrificans]
MARRTLEDWQTIIEAQLASGLTIVKYCEQNKINPKTFSSRKATLKQRDAQPGTSEQNGFVQVQSDMKTSATIMFKTPHGTLQLSSNISPEWV